MFNSMMDTIRKLNKALKRPGCLHALTVCALLLVLTPAGSANAVDLAIELPDSITARGGEFYLGEYAQIDGDAGYVEAASFAVITPSDGAFTREDVITALGMTPAAGSAVALRMPDLVTVLPESPVAVELRAMTGWKWRIAVSGLPESLGRYSIPQNVKPGASNITLRLDSGAKKASKNIKVTWYQPVVYTTQNLPKDGMIDQKSLVMRIESVGMMEEYIWDKAMMNHSSARNYIPAGNAIAASDVEQTDLVKRGASVKLVANVRGLGIEVHGIAMQRGGIGDIIKVKNLTSKKVLYGTVVGAGRVEIKSSADNKDQ